MTAVLEVEGLSARYGHVEALRHVDLSVRLYGCDVPRNPAAATAFGLILVPEGRGIFAPMTVAENLELGAYLLKGDKAEFVRRRERVLSLFPRLSERLMQIAGSMSGDEQQMLAIGRALMANPKILLLDEPSLGLAPRVVDEIMERLGELNRAGLPIILVEQKAPLALKLARRAYLMTVGSIAAEIDPRTVTSHDDLARFYLG